MGAAAHRLRAALHRRVSALRLALDTEIDATLRLLGGFGSPSELGVGGAPVADLGDRFARRLATHPEWAALGLADAGGRAIAVASRPGGEAVPPPRRRPSHHVRHRAGRRSRPRRPWLFIAAPSTGWLDFLRRYPISPDATLTLNDQTGAIIARTLNNDRWVGRKSRPSYLAQIAGRDEGAFESSGLEGQRFYSAFSRSRLAGWTIGTGVPSASVEAALRDSTVAIVAGVVATAIAVALLALRVGARVIGAMAGLERAAAEVGTRHPTPAMTRPLGIDEAETVRRALPRTSELLAARDAERDAAFAREAEARADAERTNAAKDEFIAMLGHELRNPLSAIKSASTLLAKEGVPAEIEARSHAIVARQIRRLSDLVDDMLDVARLNSGKVVLHQKRVDLAAIAGHVVAAFADARRSAHVRVDAELAPAWTVGDETRLEQVVANLLDNACKYTPEGGRVRIETGVRDGKATLVVADDGDGIAADLVPRVFDVFAQGTRTLERAEGGLGLGLTVVRRLVVLHGGSVSAESEGPGRGARFTVSLAAAAPPEAAGADSVAVAPARTGLDVVVIEDDADNRDLYRLLLEDEGHTVTLAADGHAGIAAILQRRPDVAIVDIGLPGIDGFEVARQVRASPLGELTLLVAVTGYGTPADRERALAAGFDAFLRKSFDFADFARVVVVAPRRAATSAPSTA